MAIDMKTPRTPHSKFTRAPGASKPSRSATKSKSPPKRGAKVVLLSGGNPQIAKADGDAPVQAYIDALPGWKRELGKRLDALVVRSVPEVRKAVKWNSPLYGIEGQGSFLALHTFAKFVRLAFFRGTLLRPPPPGASKVKDTRYHDIREGDALDEAQLSSWLKQAAALPGFMADRPEKKSAPVSDGSASRLIDQRIRELGGWRGETLARMRALILDADSEIIEEWKWQVPVWSLHGIVCTGETYTKVVKLTFAKGAQLPDPSRLFNSSLGGNTRRAIDIGEGGKVDARAFKALVKAAVAANSSPTKRR